MSSVVTDPPPELAPSATRAEPPTVARVVGLAGLFAAVAGAVTLVARANDRGLLPEGAGYLLGLFGLLALLIHAARDGDLEVRRLYGLLAVVLIGVGVVVGLIPGGTPRAYGNFLLPWGAGAGLAGLLFLLPFTRHETEEPYRGIAERVLLVVGGLLAVGSLVGSLIQPDFLVGPGLVLSLLGLAYLAAYLSQTDASVGRGFQVAIGVGLVGAVALAIGLGRSVVPTVLYDGPSALKTPLGGWDAWKVLARVVPILAGVGLVVLGLRKSTAPWAKGVLVVAGAAVAGTFLLGTVTNPIKDSPAPFLVPYGLLFSFLGLLYLGVSLGVVSDSPFVVLVRRELSAQFYSPVAYVVLFGVALVSAGGYFFFIGELAARPSPEPILQNYVSLQIFAVFQLMVLVPALTMRQFAEEKRTGTLEVLLTAPVDEPVIVLAKLLGTWLVYMLCFVPPALYLIALRSAGGSPFDYRPLLSYYLAVGATGFGFVAFGLFCSVITQDQLAAAFLTFAGMMVLLTAVFAPGLAGLGEGARAAVARFDFYRLWSNALQGQLTLAGVLVYLSFGVFWTFLTVKVLEARRWS